MTHRFLFLKVGLHAKPGDPSIFIFKGAPAEGERLFATIASLTLA